jgi:hypothetical protein
VIILGAVVVLLIIGMFGGAVGEMERGGARERGEEALSWADLCLEVALGKLRDNPGYTGDENIEIENLEGSCDILSLEAAGGIITIKTEGEVAGYSKKIEAEVEAGSDPLNIINWQEAE